MTLPRVQFDTFATLLSGGLQSWYISNAQGKASMRALDSKIVYIESLEINTPNRGHGTRFLEALEKRARREGFTWVTLQVGSYEEFQRPNRKLLRWYLKRGYLAVPQTKGWLRSKKLKT